MYFCFTIIALLVSCNTSQVLFKKNIVNNNENFNQSYNCINKSILGKTKVDSAITLLNLFGVYSKAVANEINIKFNDNNEIIIMYKDSTIIKTKTLKGKYKNGLFFKSYIQKKVIQIPPFFSFLYGQRVIDRIKIGFNTNGLLVVENKYVSEANILFFGSGVNYKTVSFFEINKN